MWTNRYSRDDSELPAKKMMFETNILNFFLERASTSNFCCAIDQNNPHILKYVSYDRSCLLQPCGKLFSWAPPVPLGNFYPLAPHPLGISIDHPWGGGGGYGYFLESHNYPGGGISEMTISFAVLPASTTGPPPINTD